MEVTELSLEWNHRVARVCGGNAGKSRDGSRDGVGAQETEDTELSQSPVVDLGDQTTLLLLSSPFLAKAKWICRNKKEIGQVSTLNHIMK